MNRDILIEVPAMIKNAISLSESWLSLNLQGRLFAIILMLVLERIDETHRADAQRRWQVLR